MPIICIASSSTGSLRICFPFMMHGVMMHGVLDVLVVAAIGDAGGHHVLGLDLGHALDVGAIPVAANSNLVGMITDRDITIRCVAGNEAMSKVKAKDVMTSGVVYCRDNKDVEDAVRTMEGKQIRRPPVLDEAMQVVGMVSLGDVSHALPRDITGEVAKSVSAHHP